MDCENINESINKLNKKLLKIQLAKEIEELLENYGHMVKVVDKGENKNVLTYEENKFFILVRDGDEEVEEFFVTEQEYKEINIGDILEINEIINEEEGKEKTIFLKILDS